MRADRPVTIKDIAAHLGVSNTTVSVVLGDAPSRHVRVSDATRARILQAAKEMEYRPNRVARSLRYRKTNVIGIYTAFGHLNPVVPFTAQIIGGLHQGCDDHRKDLLLHGSYPNRSPEEVYRELADGRVDGLILYTWPEDPLVARLATSHLPVVAIADPLPGLPSVTADNPGGGALLADYLWQHGHRRVYYRAGDPSITSAVQRQEAFLMSADARGMDVIVHGPSPEHHERFQPRELDWLDLPHEQRPTAVACWNDMTAYNLLEECRRRGMALPGDLAVVGFDGIVPPNPTPWRLTTVRAPWVDVARTAVSLLIRRIEGEAIPRETLLPVEFVTGDTA